MAIGTKSTLRGLSLGALAVLLAAPAARGQVCDEQALGEAKLAFVETNALRRSPESGVTVEQLRAAAARYLALSEQCYMALHGEPAKSGAQIDQGGVWFTPSGLVSGDLAAGEFVLWGTKWGAGSPFFGSSPGAEDAPGPGTPGGVVSYAYMANGVDISAEGAGLTNTAISSLGTFSACFFDEIEIALAAWSGVANVQFVPTTDNGVAFNAAGTSADIRIGAHVFDGASGVLAHAFFPPPNGATAAGDMHFDIAENWNCDSGAGLIDFGIVAAHEIGHSIGLDHQDPNNDLALMNPIYNAALDGPITDDILGAESIYGDPLVTMAGPEPDFNNDDVADILFFNTVTRRAYVWLMNGPLVIGQGSPGALLNTDWVIAAMGDFDADGKTDILWRNTATGAAYLWLIDGTVIKAQGNVGTVSPTVWAVQDVRDTNGDGRVDIVWRNTSGGIVVWFMDGLTVSSVSSLGTLSNNWIIPK